MKTFVIVFLLVFCSTITFASKVAGTWKASIETDNGPSNFQWYTK